MESGEPIPAGYAASSYQGTVWWQWTPVFGGWHEINTEGSGINTVLSVWTDNNGSGPLVLVHVNDEADLGSVSRIPISGGREHHLQDRCGQPHGDAWSPSRLLPSSFRLHPFRG